MNNGGFYIPALNSTCKLSNLNVSGLDANSLAVSRSGNDWFISPTLSDEDVTYSFSITAIMPDGGEFPAID